MVAPVPAPVAVSPWAPVTTLLEKAASQGVEAILTVYILAGTLDTTNWQKVLIAFCAAFFTVLANGTQLLVVPESLPPVVQIALRTVRSFAAAFFAPMAASFMAGGIPGLDGWKAAAFAGVIAAMTVVKGAITSKLSANDSPAILPARYDLAA